MPPSAWVPWVPAVLLVGAAAWDVLTGEIPDAFPVLLVAWAVLARAVGWIPADWAGLGIGAAIGLVVGLALFGVGLLGGGDAKVLAGLGALLGPRGFLLVFVLISVIGGVLALGARRLGRREVVYGPAIALGYVGALIAAIMS